jgi:hypothetical protein
MWIRRTTPPPLPPPSREIASVPDDRIVMGVDTYRHAQTHIQARTNTHTGTHKHTHTNTHTHICVQTPERLGKTGSLFFKNKTDFIEENIV